MENPMLTGAPSYVSTQCCLLLRFALQATYASGDTPMSAGNKPTIEASRQPAALRSRGCPRVARPISSINIQNRTTHGAPAPMTCLRAIHSACFLRERYPSNSSEGVSGNRVQGHYGKLCFLRVYISSIFFELATTKRTASAQRNANPATDTCCGATTRERNCAADSDRMERLDAS